MESLTTQPIYNSLGSILNKIKNTDGIVQIVAPNNSGRLFTLPYLLKDDGGIWIVVEDYQTSLLASTIMRSHNVPASNDDEFDLNAPVVYLSSQKFKNYLIDNYNKDIPCKMLILEEQEKNTKVQRLIISLLGNIIREQRPVPYLILSGSIKVPVSSAFPIKIEYIEVLNKSIPERIAYHNKKTVDIIEFVDELHTKHGTGTFVVIVANEDDVDRLINSGDRSDYRFIRVGDQSDSANERSIIVCTDKTLSCIVGQQILITIDTMEMMIEQELNSGLVAGVKMLESQENAYRRHRIISKYYYRTTTEGNFKSLPRSNRKYIHIDDIIRLKNAKLDYYTLLEETETAVGIEVLKLKNLLMLDDENNITEKGQYYLKTFDILSLRSSGVLWEWSQLGLPIYPCLVVVIMIDLYGRGYGTSNQVDGLPIYEDNQDHLDFILKLWITMTDFMKEKDLSKMLAGDKNRLLREWCKVFKVNYDKLEVVIKRLIVAVDRLGATVGRFTYQGVRDKLVPVFNNEYRQEYLMNQTPNEGIYQRVGTQLKFELHKDQYCNIRQLIVPSYLNILSDDNKTIFAIIA